MCWWRTRALKRGIPPQFVTGAQPLLAFIPNCWLAVLCAFWAVPTRRRIRSSLLKSTESKDFTLPNWGGLCFVEPKYQFWGCEMTRGNYGVWSKLWLQTRKESYHNNMVIYARAWHTGSCLCIRKGPSAPLILAKLHNIINSTEEKCCWHL